MLRENGGFNHGSMAPEEDFATETDFAHEEQRRIGVDLAQGAGFWREALGMPEQVNLGLSTRQVILGTFFRKPGESDSYPEKRPIYRTPASGKVTAFGLQLPDRMEGISEKVDFYPFNDEAREEIHECLVDRLEEKAAEEGVDKGSFWGKEADFWLTPFRQAVFEFNYAEAEAAAEAKIDQYWQKETENFSGNSINFRDDEGQRDRFHSHLIESGILTKDEIELILNFQETQKKAIQTIADEIVKPVLPQYESFRRDYREAEEEYARAVKLYNAHNKSGVPLSISPSRWQTQVRTNYRGQLEKQGRRLGQIRRRLESYIEAAKTTPEDEKLDKPPTLPGLMPAPEYLVTSKIRGEIADLTRSEIRRATREYRERSDFKYRETVANRMDNGGKREPEPIDEFIEGCMWIMGTDTPDSRNGVMACFDEFKSEIGEFLRLRTTYTEAMTLWGPPPKSVLQKCRRFREDTRRELSDRQPEIATNSYLEAVSVETDLAVKLGMVPAEESAGVRVAILPTGIVAQGEERYTMAVSPLEERILTALPEKYRSTWERTWKIYGGEPVKGQEVDRDTDREVARIVRELVEEKLRDLAQDTQLPETELLEMQKKYHFVVNQLINGKTGEVNPQLSADEIAALKRVMSYFGSFISAVKKPMTSQKTSPQKLQGEIKNYLAGMGPKNERGRLMPPQSLFRGATLNIDDLRQLVEQDKAGAQLTVNLLANCIGISLYSMLKPDERNEFDRMVGKKADVSQRSFYQALGNRVDDPQQRRELMKRVLFVSYFGQYITGKASAQFNDLMAKIQK